MHGDQLCIKTSDWCKLSFSQMQAAAEESTEWADVIAAGLRSELANAEIPWVISDGITFSATWDDKCDIGWTGADCLEVREQVAASVQKTH